VHIPDGYLSTAVWTTMDVLAAPAVIGIARQAQRRFDDARAPLLGVMGAFVFAAQMINFPAGVGASAHLLGCALLAITLGAPAATVVMSAIIAIQALVFQDGGVLVMGANILNMAVVGVWAGYLPFRFAGATRWRSAAIFAGGALSVLVSAVCALAELRLSGVPPATLAVSAVVFLISAPVEGAITLGVVKALEAIQPGFVRRPEPGRRFHASLAAIGLTAFLLGAVGVLFSSAAPDGIEKLGLVSGLAGRVKVFLATPFSGYETAFIASPWMSKAGAGLAGLALIFGVCVAIGRVAAARKRSV
jgi:cobalt/nickel transport system permease protein